MSDDLIESASRQPTVFRHRKDHFYFFSRDEPRMHVHVSTAEGEAKFWVEPLVALDESRDLSLKELREAERLVEEHLEEIITSWKRHFSR